MIICKILNSERNDMHMTPESITFDFGYAELLEIVQVIAKAFLEILFEEILES